MSRYVHNFEDTAFGAPKNMQQTFYLYTHIQRAAPVVENKICKRKADGKSAYGIYVYVHVWVQV